MSAAIGDDATSDLARRARQLEPDLTARSQRGFEAFAALVAERSTA